MRKSLLALAAAAMAVTAAPAMADPPPWAPAHGKRAHDAARYDRYGRYVEPRRLSANDRVWRGNDGQYHCKRDNGTTGLIIGGAAGALLGRALDGGQSRTLGTILGAAGGALIGKEIDSSGLRCR
ncbi:glycine zipper 2TM domain-containing protein [Altererythrobacter sp. Root672]|uniref:glycine zipper 2TM domain-containing protein n=1 Tax=Altererythrobacter sp. Root672 TaxID=1736584 RepID=UPI0006FE97C5|nr:glycine zipper 2TM domain-containing protein [Altererythrobacter sp. Root672]KRA84577.1 hypothetical protein ASD76_02845 [Altererythrobacter sp. Root672]